MTKLKMIPGAPELQELLKARFAWELEVLSSWQQASEIEKTRWDRAGEAVEARVGGGMYDLVEALVRDRSFERSSGVYFAPGAAGDELVYAARRLTSVGMKVVYLDWEAGEQVAELLLRGDIPVVDILEARDGQKLLAGDLGAGGSVQLAVEQAEAGGAGDDQAWHLTVEGAAELMAELEDVDVLILVAGQSAVEGHEGSELQVTIDTWAMAGRSAGRIAGAWGASVLVAGTGPESDSADEAWDKLLHVLVGTMVMEQFGR